MYSGFPLPFEHADTVILTALMSSSIKSTLNIISGLVLVVDFFVCFRYY